MFGNNEIVGQKHFKDADPNKLYVTSRFYTIQGEGPFSGRCAIFIRLAKCNLACSFCDTYFDGGTWYDIDDLCDQIETLIPENVPMQNVGVVLTGGEPLLQKNITTLIRKLDYRYAFVQIESNGIIHQSLNHSTTLVISPKCVEKNGEAIKYIKPHPKNLEIASCLKFVVESPENNVSPYNEVPDWALEWSKSGPYERPIFVSPMNIYNEEPQKSKELRTSNVEIDVVTRSEVDEKISFWEEGLLDMKANRLNHEYVGKLCMETGARLNLQTHLYISAA